MPKAKLPAADFVAMFERLGTAAMAKETGLPVRSILQRRARIEGRIGRQVTGPEHPNNTRHNIEHPGRLRAELETGTAIVFSDAHFWPGIKTTAFRALVKFCDELDPDLVDCNGDAFDGASISRHAPIGWEKRPSVVEELEACQERLGEVEDKLRKRKNVRRIWGLGNHDARFETRLATVAPEYAKVHGVHLKDHFPAWEPCWSVWINDDTVVKHRFKGGIHAAWNNTMNSGKHIVTGHLHKGIVTPFTDYNGTRYGVDSGTLADTFGPQFEYQEDNPRNHRSGFVVLTYWKGRLLWPEFVHVIEEGLVEFRGTVVEV